MRPLAALPMIALSRGGFSFLDRKTVRVCLLWTPGRRTDVLRERAHRHCHDPEARADGVAEDVVRRVEGGG